MEIFLSARHLLPEATTNANWKAIETTQKTPQANMAKSGGDPIACLGPHFKSPTKLQEPAF